MNLTQAINDKRKSPSQKSYMWRVELPDIQNPTRASYGLERPRFGIQTFELPQPTNDQVDLHERISARVINMTTPHFNINTENIESANSFWYRAGTNDIGAITVEIEEHEDGLTMQYLQGWKNLIANPNGTYNPPAFYKRNIKFYKLSTVKADSDGTFADLNVITFKGYFISSITDNTYDYTSNEISRFSATLTGDDAEYKILRVDLSTIEEEIKKQPLEVGFKFGGLDKASQRRIFERVINTVVQ